MEERGATRDEVVETVRSGQRFEAKYGRTGFRKEFATAGSWGGQRFQTKVVEAYAANEGDGWLVITVVVKYAG